MAKQKAKAQASAPVVSDSKRAGYKRKGNKRINAFDAQLARIVRQGEKRAQYDKSCTWAQPPAKD